VHKPIFARKLLFMAEVKWKKNVKNIKRVEEASHLPKAGERGHGQVRYNTPISYWKEINNSHEWFIKNR
jgi:hypothetical protein